MQDTTRNKFDQLLAAREERMAEKERKAEEERAAASGNLERASAAYASTVRPAIESMLEFLQSRQVEASLGPDTPSASSPAIFRVESSELSFVCRKTGSLDLQPTIDGATLGADRVNVHASDVTEEWINQQLEEFVTRVLKVERWDGRRPSDG